MLFDYCVPRYKCTYIFKILCNWATLWDPHFTNYHFGPHKNCNTFSLLPLITDHKGGFLPSRYFIFPPLFSHLFIIPFLSLLFLSSLWKIEEEDQELGFWRSLSLQGFKNKEWEDQAWRIRALTSLSLWISLTLGGFILVILSFQE